MHPTPHPGTLHFASSSPNNLKTMPNPGHIIWKCSYALFLSLVLFFSLPATTLAFNASNSPPTQCGPFLITWDDSVIIYGLYILPFNDSPIIVNDLSLTTAPHDTKMKTYNYTLNSLPLKSGTSFIVAMECEFGLFLIPFPIIQD